VTVSQGFGLGERLANGDFVVAGLLSAPLGGAADEAADEAAALRERGIDAFLIASRQSPRAQLSSIDLAFQLEQRVDVETIATMTTWDKAIMALQADLLGANALGIRNIVCETGNPPLLGDYPNVDGIWDVDSVGLVELVAGLNKGIDYNGMPLAARTAFLAGARFNPGAADLEAEIARTVRKIRSGASFLISRPVYELTTLRRVVDALSGETVPVMITVVPLRSFEEAEYLRHEVPDISIPEEALRTMEQAGQQAARTGAEMAADLLAAARPLVQGAILGLSGSDPAATDLLLGALS
jgi:methionine synthase / methylenetetrahydrofolate reductase(NADPH)